MDGPIPASVVRAQLIAVSNVRLSQMYEYNMMLYAYAKLTFPTMPLFAPPVPPKIDDNNLDWCTKHQIYYFWNSLTGNWERDAKVEAIPNPIPEE